MSVNVEQRVRHDWHEVPSGPGPSALQTYRWSTTRTHSSIGVVPTGDVFRVKLLVPSETMFFANPEATRTVFTEERPRRVGVIFQPAHGCRVIAERSGL